MSDLRDKLLRRLQADPGDAVAFKQLEEHYYLGKTWGDLVTLYSTRANSITDREEAARLLVKAADIADKRLKKAEQAVGLLERAMRSTRDNEAIRRDLIGRYRAAGQHQKAADLMEIELRAAPAERKREVRVEMARALAAAGEHGRATTLLREAIDAAPEDLELYGALGKVLEASGTKQELAGHYEKWAQAIPGDQAKARQARIAIWRRAASAAAAIPDPKRALHAWQEAHATDPDDDALLDGLVGAAETADDAGALADALEERAAREPDPGRAAAIFHRIGRLVAEKSGHEAAATPYYRRAFDLDARGEAGTALVALYEAQGRYDLLADLYGARAVSTTDTAARVEARRLEARVREDRLKDPQGALAAWTALLRDAPKDVEGLDARLRTLERLDRPDELIEALLAAADADPAEAADLRLRAGAVAEGRLKAPARAAQIYGALLTASPTHREAAEALARVAEVADDVEALVRGLGAQLMHRNAPTERAPILRRLGLALATIPERRDEAVTALDEALDLVPDDPEAMDSLARCYVALARWPEVVAVYRRLLALAEEPAVRTAILRKIGEISRRRLGDPGTAAEAYQEALRLDPEDRDALVGLRATALDREDWAGAVDALRREAALVDAETRAALLADAGVMAADRLANPGLAAACWREALLAAPDHAGARDRLVGWQVAEGHPAEAARVLLEGAGASADPEQALALAQRAADLLASANDLAGATAALETGLRHGADAESADGAREQLAHLYERQGRDADVARLHLAAAERAADPGTRAERLRDAGTVLWKRCGDAAGAVPPLLAAVACAPTDAALARLLHEVATAGGRPDAALVAVRAERATDPAPERAIELWRAEARLATGPLKKPVDAVAAWREVVRVAPGDVEALDALLLHARSGAEGPGMVDALLARAAVAPPAEAVPWLRDAATVALRVSDWTRALAAHREWLARAPRDPAALEGLARAAREARDPLVEAEALGFLADAEAEPAVRATALRRRATLLAGHGRPVEAAAALRALLALAPEDTVREEALRLHAALGDDAAVEAILRAWADAVRERAARLPILRRLSEHLFRRPGAGAAAERVAREVLTLAKGDPAAVRGLVGLLLARGGVSDAVAVLRDAAAATPAAAPDLLRRAAALLEQRGAADDLAAAAAALDEVVALAPAHRPAREARARLAEVAGEIPVARRLREGLLADADASAERADAAIALGQLLEGPGADPGGAVDAYLAARTADPATPLAAAALERLLAAQGRTREWRALLESEAASPRGTTASRATLWLRAGALAEADGDRKAACTAYAAALDLDPAAHPAARGLRRAAEAAGDAALALRGAEAEARGTPEGPARGRLLAEVGRRRLARGTPEDLVAARAALTDALRLAGADREACAALRRLAADAGDQTTAVAAGRAEAAMLAGPARADVLVATAALARGAREVALARECLRDALAAAADHVGALEADRDLARESGDAAGLSAALGALAVRSGDAPAWREAALAAARVGDRAAVSDRWRRALDADPSGARAGEAAAALDAALAEQGREAERVDVLARRASLATGPKEAASRWLECAGLLLRIRPAGAPAALRAAAACDPADPEPWRRLLDLAEAAGDRPGAAALALRLVTLAGAPEARALAARAAAHAEAAQDARGGYEAWRRALDAAPAAGAPTDAELHRRLVAAAERLADPALLAAACEAAAAAPGVPPAEAAGVLLRAAKLRAGPLADPARGFQDVVAAAERAPGQRAAQAALAEALLGAGRPLEATAALARERDLAPAAERPALEGRRARLLLDRCGDPGAAAEAFAAARAGRADDLELLHGWQEALRRAGRHAEWATALAAEQALKPGPVRARALREALLEAVWDALGDVKRAAETAETVVSDEGASPAALRRAAAVLRDAGRRDAAAHAQLRLRTHAKDPAAKAAAALAAGELLREAAALADARAAFAMAAADDPTCVAAHTAEADLAEAARDWPAATAALRRLADHAPTPAAKVAALARLGAGLTAGAETPDRARAVYQEALALAPEAHAVRAALTHVLEALADWPALLSHLEADPARARGGAGAATVLAREGDLLAGPLGKAKDAEARYRDALARDAGSLPAVRGLRTLLAGRREPPHAEVAALLAREAALGRIETRASLLARAAEAQVAAGDRTAATAAWRDALAADPRYRPALAGLARLLRDERRFAEAADVAARWEAACADAGEAAADEAAEAAWTRGRAGETTGELPAVTAGHFERALSADPTHPDARRGWGEALVRAGQFEPAAQVLAGVADECAEAGDAAGALRAWNHLAAAHAGRGDHGAAVAAWRVVIERTGGDAAALTGLATAEQTRGRHADAAVAWERVAEARGKSDPAGVAPALDAASRAHERGGDIAAARRTAAAACAADPAGTREVRRRLVALDEKAGDFTAVRRDLGPLLEKPGSPAEAAGLHVQAARAATQAGEAAPALDHWRRALSADPTHPPALEGLSAALQAAGDLAVWAREVEAGVSGLARARPDAALPWRVELARHYIESKRSAEAVTHLREVLARKPSDVAARVSLARALAMKRETMPDAAAEHLVLLAAEPLRLSSVKALGKLFQAMGDTARASRAGVAEALCEGRAPGADAALPAAPARPTASARERHLLTGDARHPLVALLAGAAPYLGKLYPPDLAGQAGRRDVPPQPFERIRGAATELAAAFGAAVPLEVAWAPGATVPLRLVATAPPTLLVAPSAQTWPEPTLRHALGAFAAAASLGHALLLGLDEAQMGALADAVLAALGDSGDGRDPALTKKVRNAFGRRERAALAPLAADARAAGKLLEPAALLRALRVTAARSGLLATGGNLAAACDAIGRLGIGAPTPSRQVLEKFAECADLIPWSLGEDFKALSG